MSASEKSSVKTSAMPLACIILAMTFSPAAFANAQEVVGTLDEMSDDARYQMKQEGDVFVRLDRKTGQMSSCRLRGDSLVCRMAADDRQALVEELDDLQQRIARLEEGAGDDQLSEAPKSKPRNRDSAKDHDFPLESDIDEAVEYSGKVIRKFFDVMKELRKDLNE